MTDTYGNLEPEIADNYQRLVEAGDRTWADVATMADAQGAPALAEYARAQTPRPARSASGSDQREDPSTAAGR